MVDFFLHRFFGVPQGSVILPVLFNFFVRDFPTSADITLSYADDFSLIVLNVDLGEMDRRMNRALRDVSRW